MRAFQDAFNYSAFNLFGSGWVWCCVNDSGKLEIHTTHNEDTLITSHGVIPILCADLWEHSYYIRHHTDRRSYLSDWWGVVKWETVNRFFINALETVEARHTDNNNKIKHLCKNGQ